MDTPNVLEGDTPAEFDEMNYIKNPAAAPLEIESFSYSVAQSALPAPVRANTAVMEVKRICAAAQTDVLMAASRATLKIDYKNDTTSAAALTINPNGTDTIDAAATYVLQPGDAVSLVNTSATNWSVE